MDCMTALIAQSMTRLDRGFAPRLFALLAAVALLAPSLAAFGGPDGLAWLPNHGHLFLSGGANHPHSHPWDRGGSTPPRFGVTPANGAEATVIFTAGDLGATDSAASVALPAVPLLPAIAWLTHTSEATPLVLRGLVLLPLDPPPQA